ncbi:electron transport complex subunit RsxD [Alteromonas aestuariivivens]|uniref:Ion-translocating oxidoreductase complex subunit D n=1 Tax=Alteromonas aestuariivivens TaxID=1938339 RepID=A0A3D8M6I1_9ALTE|nr:electron transport complex subunit RsxD [Alteromonas aestuariivivens]RDV25180.1 electron transport complex subunit RsxD [Alteromonas aestuariivivens]
MKLTLSSSPHQRTPRDTGQVMRLVIYAMLPGLALQWYFFGWGVIVQAILAVLAAIVTEAAVLTLRGKNIRHAVSDFSAVLTALLLAVSLPPLLPWWMTVIGAVFAIAIVKQVYGGLGYNMFNPAMVAYVMLLISFPAAMTMWMPPQTLAASTVNLGDTLSVIFTGFSNAGYDVTQLRTDWDGVTMATPLDAVKTGLTQGLTYSETLNMPVFSGAFAASLGAGWAWVSLAYAAGGLALLRLRVINWHIPVSMLASVVVVSLLIHLINQDHYASPLFHLFNGSVMLGAFFIATDPVSASTTNKGRLIFGGLIGFWVVIVRTFGGYPDAVAFAVIIMNMAVPLIDYYTRPRTYGHHSHVRSGKGKRP